VSVDDNQQNVKRFDQWVRTYNGGRISSWLSEQQRRVLEWLRLEPDTWLLDVGCGTGRAVIQAAQRVTRGMACGIDLSPGMIDQAKRQTDGHSNIEFRIADAESIPYPPESFEAVMCTNSFHHYSAPLQALSEIRRVLKPKGELLLLDPNRGGCIWVWLWDRIHRIFEKGHVKYYSEQELLVLLRKAGFHDAVVVESNHGHFQKGKIGWAVSLLRACKR